MNQNAFNQLSESRKIELCAYHQTLLTHAQGASIDGPIKGGVGYGHLYLTSCLEKLHKLTKSEAKDAVDELISLGMVKYMGDFSNACGSDFAMYGAVAA